MVPEKAAIFFTFEFFLFDFATEKKQQFIEQYFSLKNERLN
jgi:hypothetical protein